MQVMTLKRVFFYNNQELPDPNRELTPEEVKNIHALTHAELGTASITGPEVIDGCSKYTYQRQIGTKG